MNTLEPGSAGAPAPQAVRANPLAVQPRTPGEAELSDMMKNFLTPLDAAAAQYEKVKEAKGQLTVMRKALDRLAALQDTVTTEDVVEASAGLVAAGIEATEVASFLADMPTQPQALQAWVQQMDQSVRQAEAQMKQIAEQARFELGLNAMGTLLASSAEDFAKAGGKFRQRGSATANKGAF